MVALRAGHLGTDVVGVGIERRVGEGQPGVGAGRATADLVVGVVVARDDRLGEAVFDGGDQGAGGFVGAGPE